MAPQIFVNHVGFTPQGAKYFVVTNPAQEDFQIVRRLPGREVVLRGQLQRVSADLGEGWVGDFSQVQEEGNYLIYNGPTQSRPVTVYRRLYDQPLRTLFNYFPTQRCGDSLTGWHAPCHTADACSIDTGEHVDVTGGWHQSCDLRKWTFGTAFGLLGLSQLGLRPAPRWDNGQITDEVCWGNSYFHKMVRTDGGLMDHVVLPLGWQAERDLYPNNAPGMAAYVTLIGQALVAALFRESDSGYSRQCIAVAHRMWQYLTGPDYPAGPYQPPVVPRHHEWMPGFFSQNYPGSALALGDELYAALALHRATGAVEWLDAACPRASALVDLQVGGEIAADPLAACFRIGPGRDEIACAYTDGFFGPMGLCELWEQRPDHPDAARWRQAIQRIAEQKCLMAARNAWGLIPSYWYAENHGGARQAGSGYYRYFYQHDTLRAGLNGDSLGGALFLLRAYKILGDPRCFAAACRQLDWVLGCNPLDASTVEGVGRNQPERLINGDEFFPPVPQISGAVMTGTIGTDTDEIAPFRGGVEAEYDMPPTALLVWFLLELGEQ